VLVSLVAGDAFLAVDNIKSVTDFHRISRKTDAALDVIGIQVHTDMLP